ncbi:hypothetical protein RYX36_025405, partial [Vicia faba]
MEDVLHSSYSYSIDGAAAGTPTSAARGGIFTDEMANHIHIASVFMGEGMELKWIKLWLELDCTRVNTSRGWLAKNPTHALVRKTPENVNKQKIITAANPETKEELLENYQASGVILLEGDINDHETLVNAIKQVDTVLCAA